MKMEEQLKQLANQAASDVEFICSGAENFVKVAGSWNNWRPRNLIYNELADTWQLSIKLSPGTYQYKYIVDGEWIHDPSSKCREDDKGNINNVLKVDSKLDILIRNYRMASLKKTVERLKKTKAEIKELKQKLGTSWYSEVQNYKMDQDISGDFLNAKERVRRPNRAAGC